MTTKNFNKIVQSKMNLKPWTLSKNTNELVNTYIQKIYKQMPTSFRKDVKNVAAVSPKAENRGPLSNWKYQERQNPTVTITSRGKLAKESSSKMRQQTNSLLSTLNLSNHNNQKVASKIGQTNIGSNKRILKTPNYKIYKSVRYGSSSSSSRSSLFKRYDERRRQRQSTPAQISYLMRAFHTSNLDATYTRYLMPARNQHLEANFGSIPDAIRFSSSMLEDLMKIDKVHKPKASNSVLNELNAKQSGRVNYRELAHPISIDKLKLQIPKDSATRHVSSNMERTARKARHSPEHRDYLPIKGGRGNPLSHTKPPNELFTALHDRNNTELHEKHRRNRMKKLGLVNSGSDIGKEASWESMTMATRQYENSVELRKAPFKSSTKPPASAMLGTKAQSKSLPKLPLNINQNKDKKPKASLSSQISVKANNASTAPITAAHSQDSIGYSVSYSSVSPITVVRSHMPEKSKKGSFRYNGSDIFSTKKY